MAGEMLTGGMAMVFARYGSFWRRLRGAARHGFSTKAVEKYQATLASEAAQAAFDIVQTPADWEKRLKRAIASSILRATYGWPQIKEEESELITRMEAHIARLTNALISAALLIDFFPIIKYVPTWMAKWKRDALEWHKRDTRMFEGFYDGVRRKKMNDQQSDCFVSTLIENEERNGFTQKENAWLAGILFTAGAETTASAMSYFVLAMTLYPDVMRKAQAELDAVVGRERLPTFADQAQLPYINALCKEVLRWRPVGPLAVPRRTIKDDWYEGYLIPKGTIVIPNVWAINRDSNVYPDFDVFHPERFLDDAVEKTLAPLTHSMGHVTYGFGRRICAGYNFANQAMFIDIATLLWAFDIEKAVDEFGHVIVPSSTECIDAGAAVSPAPFKCRITPRFHEVEAILKWEQASRSE
ncbi:uncharacterized protein FIBRA_06231 [Fibroporia radiculosa]|uniref:Cytochrome P450 n=1 Tax=Fibroporia radiculosa TaxID=599839 RepID=J4HYS7_9APHY|nr:uncharacterized protein FIBRA_06231 [Fibroporia radiculosa]CCM04072.1 predicted protein [Fibroporia radiculosa]